MSFIHNSALAGASGQGGAYEIEQSVKFDANRGAYLNRTPSSAGNRKTWTWSGWVKRTGFGQNFLFSTGADSSNRLQIAFENYTNDNLSLEAKSGGSTQALLTTTASYRDSSGWYHIVVALDTPQATAANRLKFYINGEQVSTFQNSTYPSQDAELEMNKAIAHNIGKRTYSSNYFDGYQAEVNFIDGTALDPTDFGEFDNNGVWRPIKYAGSYTGNSFYLKFEQGALGTDSSGLSNDWTANELWEEIGTPDYAGNWIGSTSGSFYSGSWENVFNGDVTVYSNYIYAYNNTATLTFSTALSGVIEVYGSDGGAGDTNSGYISLSDGSTWSINSIARSNAQWHSFGSKTGITTITVSSPGGHGAILGAIRVDGDLLANISAKANYVNMSDTPTTNWCTLNPNDSFQQTVSNGNLVSSNTNNVTTPGIRASMAMPSGKWYWEITCGVFTSARTWMIGVADTYEKISTANYTSSGSYLYYSGNGNKYNGSSNSSYGATYTTGDVIGVAYDADNGKIWFAKNNTWQNSGDPAAGTGEAYSGITGDKSPYVGTGLYQVQSFWNFGQRDFEYTPPTGFEALNTANLPEPDIADGSDYFNTVLWSGDGVSGRAITGVGFQPDFLWIKRRNVSISHYLQNSIAGATYYMFSNDPVQERNLDDSVDSFDTDGFTLGNDGGTNGSGGTYVGWNWLAGGTGSSNTDGSITSTVSANPTAGFSVVTYTGTGANATVGHGLGVAPAMVIIKNRTTSNFWVVGHTSLGFTTDNYLRLNAASAKEAGGGVAWNNTAPTSTVVHIGSSSVLNGNGNNYVAYCFSEVEGYSKFGGYTGNGSTDGTFVYCGFRPRWIMVKTSSNAYGWAIHDTTRQTYNEDERILQPNTSGAEATNSLWGVDILSNGFKWRNDGEVFNFSGYTYIFAAFAEHPFGGSGVSPATAR